MKSNTNGQTNVLHINKVYLQIRIILSVKVMLVFRDINLPSFPVYNLPPLPILVLPIPGDSLPSKGTSFIASDIAPKIGLVFQTLVDRSLEHIERFLTKPRLLKHVLVNIHDSYEAALRAQRGLFFSEEFLFFSSAAAGGLSHDCAQGYQLVLPGNLLHNPAHFFLPKCAREQISDMRSKKYQFRVAFCT